MDAENFRRIATELYGQGWVTVLSQALNMNARTLREMAQGKRFIPERLASALLTLQDFTQGRRV
tara:strand:+ start:84 stop:275 length:192 start_codon:yes stop_codon:yes gene_type:complete